VNDGEDGIAAPSEVFAKALKGCKEATSNWTCAG
jgi:hypothetical protein